ncbi:unnamed protein product [Mytilus coruscus]|uniref:Uncharacterized protein n=1 Tax=Mytilus coruscus TaxID=42192 RepID=A0A6J8E4L2_MYTCO|nr:unnamed protein product [Mytilus coruscus]
MFVQTDERNQPVSVEEELDFRIIKSIYVANQAKYSELEELDIQQFADHLNCLTCLKTNKLSVIAAVDKYKWPQNYQNVDGVMHVAECISAYKIQDFVIILAFLVPWRVIRVVNSLVVAVIDHEHFRLKLLYKQKKEVSHDLKKTKSEVKNLQQSLDIVRRLANEAGVTEQKISQHLGMPLSYEYNNAIMAKQSREKRMSIASDTIVLESFWNCMFLISPNLGQKRSHINRFCITVTRTVFAVSMFISGFTVNIQEETFI